LTTRETVIGVTPTAAAMSVKVIDFFLFGKKDTLGISY
jgi:hypothetical protein